MSPSAAAVRRPSAGEAARAVGPVTRAGGERLAVAIHGVTPGAFERVVALRDRLGAAGIDRVTFLVIPAADLHPFHDRSPKLAQWLRERVAAGDAVAQHGLQHRQTRRANPPRQTLARWQAQDAAEFVGLDAGETRRAVESGWRLLKLAGVEPRGFVAPGYAYTPSLREALGRRYAWWADLLWVHGGARPTLAPAVGLGTNAPLTRLLSGLMRRSLALTGGSLLRVDLHPEHLACAGRGPAFDEVTRVSAGRTPVTYDDLCLNASEATSQPSVR